MDFRKALKQFRFIGGIIALGLGAFFLPYSHYHACPDDPECLNNEVLYYASSIFQGYAAILAIFLILIIFSIEYMHNQEKERKEIMQKKYESKYLKIISPILKIIDSNPKTIIDDESIKDFIGNDYALYEHYNSIHDDVIEYQKWKRQKDKRLNLFYLKESF